MTSLDQLINERGEIKVGLKLGLATCLTSATMLLILSTIEPRNDFTTAIKYLGSHAGYSFLGLGSAFAVINSYRLIRNSLQIKRYD